MTTFSGRLAPLQGEKGLQDGGMRRALEEALQPGETPRALYTVSAHIWLEAVLTDRSLLFVKGAFKAKVTRVELPVHVLRPPKGLKEGVRIRTPFGAKTLWNSKLDPHMSQFLAYGAQGDRLGAELVDTYTVSNRDDVTRAVPQPAFNQVAPTATEDSTGGRLTWRERREARRRAGRKPKRPKRKVATRARVGFSPSQTIWDLSYQCVKCGRTLTNPDSQRHRVGTECIKAYGSQAREIPNPAYVRWSRRRDQAEIERIAKQARFDAQHAKALERYQEALDAWRRIREGRVDGDS